MIEFINCADENTPEGLYADVAETAKVNSKLGYWTKVGYGAFVGRNSDLGNWSKVAPYAVIGNNVTFGPWAKIGIEARVESGASLGGWEYVPSAHLRKRNGNVVPLKKISPHPIHKAYDRYATAIPSGCYTQEQMYWMKLSEERAAQRVADLAADFFVSRKDGCGIQDDRVEIKLAKALMDLFSFKKRGTSVAKVG